MTDIDNPDETLEAEVPAEEATREIAKAVTGRRALARQYVKWLRRRNPSATPAEIVAMLERHYVTSITTAGAAITVGSIAADIAIASIPIAGPAVAGAKSAGAQAAKSGTKVAMKAAAKNMAKNAARTGAKGAAARLLPAGDQQLQFEITAVFGLAVADLHGMDLDKDQAQALVLGLTNERVSQQQIAAMATDVAEVTSEGTVSTGRKIAAGRDDWSHWATTLSDALPGGAAQSLMRTIQTGELDPVRRAHGQAAYLDRVRRRRSHWWGRALRLRARRGQVCEDCVPRTAGGVPGSPRPDREGRRRRRGVRQPRPRRSRGRRSLDRHVGQRCCGRRRLRRVERGKWCDAGVPAESTWTAMANRTKHRRSLR